MKWFRKRSDPVTPPEWMLVGLGNPGPEYHGTRHNVGFLVLDELAKRHGLKINKAKNRALYALGTVGGRSCLLVKPLTFMNLSGQAVKAFAREHGLKPENILVIADDMHLVVGRIRLKPKGSAGGHNGHKSIIQLLGSQEYPRLKIGIGSTTEGTNIEHVLGKFEPDERNLVNDAIRLAADGCEAVVTEGLERAMNRVNPSGGATTEPEES